MFINWNWSMAKSYMPIVTKLTSTTITKLFHVECIGKLAGDITLTTATVCGNFLYIKEKMGCGIEMNQAKDQTLTVIVTGPSSSVGQAMQLMNSGWKLLIELKIPDELETTTAFEEVCVDHKLHPCILGKKGRNVKKIRTDRHTYHLPPYWYHPHRGRPQGCSSFKKIYPRNVSQIWKWEDHSNHH